MNFYVESRIMLILINDWRTMIYINIVFPKSEIYCISPLHLKTNVAK